MTTVQEYRALLKKPKQSKYRNKRTRIGDIVLDSKREANRYSQLLLLQRSRTIAGLVLQPEFPFYIEDALMFKYIADFSYFHGGKRVIEDVKGVKTAIYKLKKKIIEKAYGIKIMEV